MLACGESRECAGKARNGADYLNGAHRENSALCAVAVVVIELGAEAVDHNDGRRVAAALCAVRKCACGQHDEHNCRKNE